MLLSLCLKDFVIVDALELDFERGFTALTGETGAGKSILLDALALTMGARADVSAIREGMPRADLSARFRTTEPIEAWLARRELVGDPGVVLLRRVIEADGRSRALINGQPATAALLRELGDSLLDIHGQHAAQSLLRADGQRMLIDAFGGLQAQAQVQALGEHWSALRTTNQALAQALSGQRESELERERLDWQIDQLRSLALASGEWEELNEEQRRLAHAASLLQGSQGLADALKDSDQALAAQLHGLLQRLRGLVAIDARLEDAVQMLESAEIQIDEAASTLAAYAGRVELDPQRLQQTEDRIAAIFDTARRLRITPESIPQIFEQLQVQAQALDDASNLDTLRARADAAHNVYDAAARSVSTMRADAARRLADGVNRHLLALGMRDARFEIAIDPREPGPAGVDAVEFRVAAHGGASARPLAKVASGGELSRIGLAISVVAAQANPVPTLIFDEADAGVGGAVADAIGALMRRLGDDRQVLCVTHLPQVASKAHHHLRVTKESAGAGQAPATRIAALDRSARIEEIARMLGGAEITSTTRRHAREMLAQTERQTEPPAASSTRRARRADTRS